MAVGDHSQLVRFQPRPAAMAAASPERQHRELVKRVQKQQMKRRLPRTQYDFYKQAQEQQR
jgi:hypothetical protein